MNQLWRWIRRHRKEERGAVLVLTAISMFAVLGAGAMGVDLGFTVYGSRQAQAIADTAAADVIQYITAADQQSSAQALQQTLNTALAGVLKDNNSDANLTVTPMLYQNGTYVVPSGSLGCVARKPPNSAFPVCNAVAIGAKQTVPQPFWGGFNTLSGHAGSGLPVGGGCGTTTSGGCGSGVRTTPRASVVRPAVVRPARRRPVTPCSRRHASPSEPTWRITTRNRQFSSMTSSTNWVGRPISQQWGIRVSPIPTSPSISSWPSPGQS